MKFNMQKFLIAIVCTTLGWGVGYYMGKKKAEDQFSKMKRKMGISQFFGVPFSNPMGDSSTLLDRFFGPNDHSDTEQDDLNEKNEHEEDGSLSDNPFSLFGTRKLQPQIKTREDEQFVYMELDLDSFDKKSLSAKVENGNVIIEGNQKSDENGSSMSSHFYQSFPAPAGTDTAKVDMNYENNKLILKFPKIKQ